MNADNAHPRPLAAYYFGNDPARQQAFLDRTTSGAAVINDVPGALNFLAYKKEIQPGQGLEAVSEKFASFILSAPDRFNTAVLQYNTPAAQ